MHGERVEAYTRCWWENLRGRDHLGDPSIDWGVILIWIFRKCDVRTWTGSSWLTIGTGGGRLWVRWWTFGFHKMRGVSWLAANRLASREGLFSMDWEVTKHVENSHIRRCSIVNCLCNYTIKNHDGYNKTLIRIVKFKDCQITRSWEVCQSHTGHRKNQHSLWTFELALFQHISFTTPLHCR
jgi:hypothetical protein